MTLIVNQLETFDKSNLEMIRIEFFKLQKKLEECQKEQEFLKPDIGESVGSLPGKVEIYSKWKPLFLFHPRKLQFHWYHRNQQTNGDSTKHSSQCKIPVWRLGQGL